MAELKIAVVSAQPPREWQGSTSLMKTYKVKFEGDDRVVEVNKPGNEQPPQMGDVLYGEIEVDDKFGPRFKKAKQQFNRTGKPFVRDDKEIRAQMAVKTAATVVATNDTAQITELAKFLYRLVDDLKGGSDANAVSSVMGLGDELDKPIDLSSIPF